MPVPPVILTIAGYDPSSGAGISADVKTAAALGCYAVTCLTALTVQSTQGVFAVQDLTPDLVRRTLETIAADFDIAATKLGMLGSGQVAEVVADFLEARRPPSVLLDPIIRSSSGAALLDEPGLAVMRTRLVGLADVVTPNVGEAAVLCGYESVEDGSSWDTALPLLRQMAIRLKEMGAKAVVITGGHLDPPNDYLLHEQARSGQAGSIGGGDEQLNSEKEVRPSVEEIFVGERLNSPSTHGTGCAFSTALACHLALGKQLPEAVRLAKAYVRKSIAAAYPLGKGAGPVNHFG